MKNPFTFVIDSVCTFLLIIGTLECLASSFAISADFFVVGAAALIFTLAFSLVSKLVESTKKFAASITAMMSVFVLMLLLSLNVVINQLGYALNNVLSLYSKFLSVPNSINLGRGDDNATVLFVFIAALLAFIFSVTLIRCRIIIPTAAISILLLIPCFILVTTLPSIFWLFVVLTVLFALLITSNIHRRNPHKSGVVTLCTAFASLALILAIFALNPISDYERYEWQEDLLTTLEELTGIKSENGKGATSAENLQVIRDNFKEFKDLSKLGPMQKSDEVAFQIQSINVGTLYLKGVSYANYEDSTWSVLTNSQASNLPKDSQPFTQTKANGIYKSSFTISSEKKQEIIFTPYFMSEIPDGFTPVADVSLKNDLNAYTYELEYYPYSGPLYKADKSTYYLEDTEENSTYRDYVYDEYLGVPDDVKKELLRIAKENGLTGLDTDKIPDKVKDFVINSAEYSLNTPTASSDKDFVLWFLEDSDTGYCAHFATATTLMLRSLGVPARYVTGYYVNIDSDEEIDVLSNNAHAWTEYYDDHAGWIPIDSTPVSFNPEAFIQVHTTPQTTATEAQPTTTQPETTAPQTTSAPPVTLDSVNSDINISPLALALLIVVGVLSAAILSVIIRRYVILHNRKNHFYKGRKNSQAVHIYRYIILLSKYAHIVITDEIENIATKARFSNHTVKKEELLVIRNFAESSSEEFMNTCSRLKKLYFKYIVVLA